MSDLDTVDHVPENYMGVWQRQLLETPTTKDDTSLVLWMQTQQYHIDIRIPSVRSAIRKVRALAEYTQQELLLLAGQQGFAGLTKVHADICQWHRQFDFQPLSDVRDIAKMVFSDSNTITETGTEATYLEIWQRLEVSQGPYFFKCTTGKNRIGLRTPAYIMRAGNWVAYARPRSLTLLKFTTLNDAISSCKPQREALLDWLDMEISFGEIVDDSHWIVKHSTLPFLEHTIVAFDF